VKRIFYTIMVTGALLAPSRSSSQIIDSLLRNKRVYTAVNIGQVPVPRIDGILDDSIWTLGDWQGDFTQQQPNGGKPGTEVTWLKVLYDHSNLYAAVRCMESEPDQIRDIFDRRDVLNGDMTGIAIDSYYDKRTAFEFTLSAAGQKIDNKHLGDYLWDFNWDAVWEGATSKNDSSWIAEFRIPFSQIRYANRAGHTWGMHVWRWISRRHEEDQWQWIPLDAPAMVYLFGTLTGIDNIRTSRQVEFLPYTLVSLEQNPAADRPLSPGFNAGLDAKIGISSDYTVDVSVNPDFGQVEADPSVLNLTSFETFYEEKRPLFLEGAEIFDFEMDGDIPYYSRRIGSAPSFPQSVDGLAVSDVPDRTTILGAVKLTGKSPRGLSMGFIDGMAAAEYGHITGDPGETGDSGEVRKLQVVPMSNFATARIKREFDGSNRIIGGVLTLVDRFQAEKEAASMLPSTAFSGGMDLLQYWQNKNYLLEVKGIAGMMEGTKEAILKRQLSHNHLFQRPDADYLGVDSLRGSLGGHGALLRFAKLGGSWNFSFMGQYRSPGLNLNDMGYIREADLIGQHAELAYRKIVPGKWFRNYTVRLFQESYWTFGGENTRNQAGVQWNSMNNGLWSFNGKLTRNFTCLDIRELRGGPALRIDPWYRVSLSVNSDYAKDLAGTVSWFHTAYSPHGKGNRVQGKHQDYFEIGGTWLPVRKVKLSLYSSLEWREYYQQYVPEVSGTGSDVFVVGEIDQRTFNMTFRGELFFSPEMSLQYYGSPYFSSGEYGAFRRVSRAAARDLDRRLEELAVIRDPQEARYAFQLGTESYSFPDPDFSFSQFRSNLVFRWEYKLGSTLYLVWSHERTGWENACRPLTDTAGDLLGLKGNNIFMLKLNYWFSL
jgi:hypothetical protein